MRRMALDESDLAVGNRAEKRRPMQAHATQAAWVSSPKEQARDRVAENREQESAQCAKGRLPRGAG